MASKKPPVKAKKTSAAKSRAKTAKPKTRPASAAKSQRAHVSKSSAAQSKSSAAKTKTASARKKASEAARSAVTKSEAEKAAARKAAAKKAAAKKAAAKKAAAARSAATKAAAKKAAASRKSATSNPTAAKAKIAAAKRQGASVATENPANAAIAKPVETQQAAPVLKTTTPASATGSSAGKPQSAGVKVPPSAKGIVPASSGAAAEVRKAKASTTPTPPAPPRAAPDQKRPIGSEPARVSMNLSSSAAATSVQKSASSAVSGTPGGAAPAARPGATPKPRPSSQKLGFKLSEHIVYPAHGVGQIVGIEVQEVAGFSLELFVVSFVKDKMILKVPTSKVASVGMRKLSESDTVEKALTTLSGRARIKRTMWSRRAQEYEAKINSGDLVTIAEVVRDLYRSDTQPEQSYSERQLYEAALDRMSREISVVRKLIDSESLKVIESYLAKGPRRGAKSEPDAGDAAGDEGDVERAA
ncbi:CarD family transcriptional regulator [Methylocystis bryophila]|uniref:CarD family transcriptional regulator n=1 Tax=Methylocystis bryophila TaxID=655015 RepID=UPI0026BE88FF